MELRSEDVLRAWHTESEKSSHTYAALRQTLGGLAYEHSWPKHEQDAFDVGVKIAGSLGRHLNGEAIETDYLQNARERVLRNIGRRATGPLEHYVLLRQSLNRVALAAPYTARTFESIAVKHVDGDERRLDIAKKGAAAFRYAAFEIDTIAHGYESLPPIALVVRSGQDL